MADKGMLTTRARAMRKQRRLDVKFRRQFPIDCYIADLASVEARILERGCFISEHNHVIPFGKPAFRERLLDRDRIISAMCDIFLVFECNQDSATVGTAIRALSQGKTVVCVESSMRTARRGTEQLVARGKVPWLQEKELGAVGIAAAIEAILADVAKPASASAELASPVRG